MYLKTKNFSGYVRNLKILIFSFVLISSVSLIPMSVFGQASNEITDNTITGISFFDQVSLNYEKSLWGVGKNLSEGNSYTYKICNDSQMSQMTYPDHCYSIELTFVSLMESYKGNVWIVQGYLTIGDKTTSSILFVNPDTFEVESDKLNVDLASSLENTIFSLSKYAYSSLSIGTQWDEIDSYFTNPVPLEVKRFEEINSAINTTGIKVLAYDVITESSYFINEDFPFPIKASLYSPQIIFPEPVPLFFFELVNYSTANNGVLYDDGLYCVYSKSTTFEPEESVPSEISNFGWENLEE